MVDERKYPELCPPSVLCFLPLRLWFALEIMALHAMHASLKLPYTVNHKKGTGTKFSLF